MAGLNKVQIIGNVGQDPTLRYTPRGAAVTTFSVAVNRRYTPPDGGEARDETEWFTIVAWEKLADLCNQLVTKGRKVYIEGRLQTRSWEDQQGQKRSKVEVVAQVMLLLDNRQGGGGQRDQGTAAAEPDYGDDGDIPF